MQYYSLNRQSPMVDFVTATLLGQAPDKGLYFPERIPQLDKNFWQDIAAYDDVEIGWRMLQPYVGDAIGADALRTIIAETIAFPLPLVRLRDDFFVLELVHGPTLAFKDVGARFMSRCLRHFATAIQKRIVVLVATSGDTGGAVAHGFYDAEGVDVVILYPKGKVSAVQEQQLTALGKNITALEVEGSFDDCQRMVKAAFADAELTDALQLTSANSINIARWLPQQLYYALAWKQWPYKNEPPVVCVPSGNFGNLCAAMLLQASGLPVQKFIAACNANDTIPRFLQDGELAPHDTVATLSNAMDVARPSNWVRIMELAGNDPQRLHALLEACRVDDAQTLAAMRQLYEQYNYTCDPHTAVACEALTQYQQRAGGKGYIVSTAHAVKFADVVEAATQQKIGLPESVKALMAQPSAKLAMGTGYGELKRYLKEKFGV